jgi:hypothetical protein
MYELLSRLILNTFLSPLYDVAFFKMLNTLLQMSDEPSAFFGDVRLIDSSLLLPSAFQVPSIFIPGCNTPVNVDWENAIQ